MLDSLLIELISRVQGKAVAMAPKSQIPTHTVPSQLVWQLVKNYNCFLHKGLNGSQFSAERGNLYNKNSYKYSGQSAFANRSRKCRHGHAWMLHRVTYINVQCYDVADRC